jgi:cadmium resistance protein CadD (predicted permease)
MTAVTLNVGGYGAASVMKKRPALVTAISWVLIASGAAGLAYHIPEFTTVNKLDYVLVSLLRARAIVAGGFMLRGSNWARWLSMLLTVYGPTAP